MKKINQKITALKEIPVIVTLQARVVPGGTSFFVRFFIGQIDTLFMNQNRKVKGIGIEPITKPSEAENEEIEAGVV